MFSYTFEALIALCTKPFESTPYKFLLKESKRSKKPNWINVVSDYKITHINALGLTSILFIVFDQSEAGENCVDRRLFPAIHL